MHPRANWSSSLSRCPSRGAKNRSMIDLWAEIINNKLSCFETNGIICFGVFKKKGFALTQRDSRSRKGIRTAAQPGIDFYVKVSMSFLGRWKVIQNEIRDFWTSYRTSKRLNEYLVLSCLVKDIWRGPLAPICNRCPQLTKKFYIKDSIPLCLGLWKVIQNAITDFWTSHRTSKRRIRKTKLSCIITWYVVMQGTDCKSPSAIGFDGPARYRFPLQNPATQGFKEEISVFFRQALPIPAFSGHRYNPWRILWKANDKAPE